MAEEGVKFRLVDGWRTRARSSGGIDQLLGLWWHHTVSNTTPENDVVFCTEISSDAPIGSGILARDGVFWLHTAGATNTNGRGGPWFTSVGVIPLDNGNRNGAAIEAANNGLGELWPAEQTEAYVRLSASFINMARREFGVPMEVDSILAHHEWAPDRKTDPSGPPDPWGGPGRTLWRMDEARGDVLAYMLRQPPVPVRKEKIVYIVKDTPKGKNTPEYWIGDLLTARKLGGTTQAKVAIELAERAGTPLKNNAGDDVTDIAHVVAADRRRLGVPVAG